MGPNRAHDGPMSDLRSPTETPLTVGMVMTPYPVVLGVDTPLDEVAERLAQNGITGAPVVDGDGFLVGVVSQTDLVRVAARLAAGQRSWSGFTARHVMTHEPITATASQPLVDAIRRLERYEIHRLVVVGDDGRTPIGIVSTSDLLPLLVDAADL